MTFINVNQPHEFIIDSVNHYPEINDDAKSIKGFFEAAAGVRIKFDFTQLADTEGIKNIQTVFIDNSDNDGKLIFICESTNQKIIVKSGMQGYYPILCGNKPKFIVEHSGTGIKKIPLLFLNFIISQGTW